MTIDPDCQLGHPTQLNHTIEPLYSTFKPQSLLHSQKGRQIRMSQHVVGPWKRYEFSWSLEPIKVTGYIGTNTYEAGITIRIADITVGIIYGNLHDGIFIKINL
ncbi:hypothetical protein F4825DRAFT_453832 [Nemania diffusa]|nr:hypothetical protein F4825DRAFT_453832 [Nemania diffusa]